MAAPRESQVRSWLSTIERTGVKAMKGRALLGHFGYKRRGSANQEEIEKWAKARGLHVNGLRWLRSLDGRVEIRKENADQIGYLADEERYIVENFAPTILKRVGKLHSAEVGFTPNGTRDKFDFLCRGSEGEPVVLEIKKRDGERRVVEQVLRYMQHLRQDQRFKGEEPRAVIVTGIADAPTLRALEEVEARHDDCFIDWWLYGFEDPELRKITLKRQRPARGRAPARKR